jgi:F420-dependent oxidoreductase-like protein
VIEIAIMIEGQNGLNWSRWQHITAVVEECGFAGLFRSDHYTNASPPDKDSLELWTSLTWVASNTQRIEFGPLVTPVSFRHPTMTARMAAAVDDLSGGRLILGVGAGWQEREHRNYGWDLLDISERFNRFEEGLDIITMLMKSDNPVDYAGRYFLLNEAILLPRPQRVGGPPLLIGGNGIKKTLPLAARYANEWNGIFLPPEEFQKRNRILDELLISQGRQPDEVRRSIMTGCIFGRNEDEVTKKVNARTNGQQTIDELRRRGLVIGTEDDILKQLNRLEKVGVQRVMLQWLDLDDIDSLRAMAEAILI